MTFFFFLPKNIRAVQQSFRTAQAKSQMMTTTGGAPRCTDYLYYFPRPVHDEIPVPIGRFTAPRCLYALSNWQDTNKA